VQTQLATRGAPLQQTRLTTEGVSARQPVGGNPEANRCVTFKIEQD
jgi:hypothetical protein